ncbi:MAG: UDP-3-O-acyl-N-acetylglucosamine deacetylase [Desulfobacterales bacterium]|jgi:UDP-3-O-[3-hydroxymyristoyl] N-acetylglucosamine deacetylase|nr:UDP-3-O-acyl-N-acetylglucosamine deacetylase [Desulfobacterales bacterium]
MSIETHQQTLARPVQCTGIGVHSGRQVNLKILPAATNHGIKFLRTDLPGKPIVSAHFNSVVDTSLATVIGADGVIVSTIEHLMASFSGLCIDNALVELDGYEIPIMDGSAAPFTRLLQSAGLQRQEALRCYFIIRQPISLREGAKSVTVFPAAHYRISYSIDFDHPLIRQQDFSVVVTRETFDREISPARTFGFYYEIEYLKRYGLAQGGSLENAIVIDQDKILNTGGLRFTDEFVRHKLLDCIGDFSLLGMPILGHIVLKRSGHAFNHAFLEKFFASKDCWETRTFDDDPQLTQAQAKSMAI